MLYEGDAWLSHHSLYLRGIFTSEEDLERYTQDMEVKGVIDSAGKERLLHGNRQCSGIGDWSRRCFIVNPTKVNPTEYDG